jgi:photosynthetic reaction center cytochrome c subunit
MVRALNNDYMVPLTGTFAHNMLGPSGDVAKINCATCHQGAYKPLLGAKMAAQYPYLEGPGTLADPNPKSPAASGEANPAMITMTAATTTPAASSPSSTTASPSTNTAPASSATTKPTQ